MVSGESKLMQMCQAILQVGQLEDRTRALAQEVLKRVDEWTNNAADKTDAPDSTAQEQVD